VAQAFNTTAMLYQDSPYTLNSDPYNRWRVTPGEMVPDYLIRDLRKMNLFRAVYSYHDFANTRYVLQGQVEDFLEMDERGFEGLGMNVTLLDLTKKRSCNRCSSRRTIDLKIPSVKTVEHAGHEQSHGETIAPLVLISSDQQVRGFTSGSCRARFSPGQVDHLCRKSSEDSSSAPLY
jgi:hypothetical protein